MSKPTEVAIMATALTKYSDEPSTDLNINKSASIDTAIKIVAINRVMVLRVELCRRISFALALLLQWWFYLNQISLMLV